MLIRVCFFYKQKTAYELSACLVGSEMCIRDSQWIIANGGVKDCPEGTYVAAGTLALEEPCLLYTSDSADDLRCVDLGGRRTIKKKKKKIYIYTADLT